MNYASFALHFGVLILGSLSAGLVHAQNTESNETTTTIVQAYTIDQTTHILHVQGRFRNLCQSEPRVVLNKMKFTDDGYIAQLDVVANKKSEGTSVCAEMIWGAYDLLVDLRTLNLPTQTPVEVFFAGHDSQIIYINDHQVPHNGSTIQRSGRIVRYAGFTRGWSQHRFALQTRIGENLPLVATVDLESYVGKHVDVYALTKQSDFQDTDVELKNTKQPSKNIKLVSLQHRDLMPEEAELDALAVVLISTRADTLTGSERSLDSIAGISAQKFDGILFKR